MKSGHKNVSGSRTSYLFTWQSPEILRWKTACYKLYIRVVTLVLRRTVTYSFERPENKDRMEVKFVPLFKLFIHLKLQNHLSVKFCTGSLHVILFKTFSLWKVKLIFYLKFTQKTGVTWNTASDRTENCAQTRLLIKHYGNKGVIYSFLGNSPASEF